MLYHSLLCLSNGTLLPKEPIFFIFFHAVAYFILYTTLLCYNFMCKFLYSFLFLLVTHSCRHILGRLNFVTDFSVVSILKSSFLHHMKLFLFLMNALTFRDIISKILRIQYIFLHIALTALNNISRFNCNTAVIEGFFNTELGLCFIHENVLPHEPHSLYL